MGLEQASPRNLGSAAEIIETIAEGSAVNRLNQRVAELEAQKDAAYRERNLVVALAAELVKRFTKGEAFLAPHTGEDWGPEWKWVLFLEFIPGMVGQVSWHIHRDELYLFDRLPRLESNPWDGHTTEEKYDRIREYVGEFR